MRPYAHKDTDTPAERNIRKVLAAGLEVVVFDRAVPSLRRIHPRVGVTATLTTGWTIQELQDKRSEAAECDRETVVLPESISDNEMRSPLRHGFRLYKVNAWFGYLFVATPHGANPVDATFSIRRFRTDLQFREAWEEMERDPKALEV